MLDDTDGAGDVMDALADPRRRRALSALADREPPVGLHELAAAVSAAEEPARGAGEPAPDGGTTAGDSPDGGRTDEEGPSVAATLYHVHLPKLDDAGVVAFDPGSKEVRDWWLDGTAGEFLQDPAAD